MSTDQSRPARPLEYPGPFSDDVYRDRVNGWRRRFTLDGDRLIIQQAKFLGSESESAILLREIDPTYGIVRHRSEAAIGGIVSVGGVLAILGVAAHYQGTLHVLGSLSSLPLEIIGLLYLILCLKNIRRVELHVFRHCQGRFDIARRGPDRDRFDTFIARLISRVEALRTPVQAVGDRGDITSKGGS